MFFQIEFSLLTRLLSVNDILLNFNLFIFEPPQSLFFCALTCFLSTTFFFLFFRIVFGIFSFFCVGTQKWVTTVLILDNKIFQHDSFEVLQ